MLKPNDKEREYWKVKCLFPIHGSSEDVKERNDRHENSVQMESSYILWLIIQVFKKCKQKM